MDFDRHPAPHGRLTRANNMGVRFDNLIYRLPEVLYEERMTHSDEDVVSTLLPPPVTDFIRTFRFSRGLFMVPVFFLFEEGRWKRSPRVGECHIGANSIPFCLFT